MSSLKPLKHTCKNGNKILEIYFWKFRSVLTFARFLFRARVSVLLSHVLWLIAQLKPQPSTGQVRSCVKLQKINKIMETLWKSLAFLNRKIANVLGTFIVEPMALIALVLYTKLQFQPPRMRDFRIAKRDFYANTTNFNKLWKLLTIFGRIVTFESLNYKRPNYLERRKEPLFYAAISFYCFFKSDPLNFNRAPFTGRISRMNCDFLTPTEARQLAKLTYENSDFQLSLKFYLIYQK